MRIIKLGMIEEIIKNCPNCNTEFAYLSKDIEISKEYGYCSGWVSCPACETKIILWKNISE